MRLCVCAGSLELLLITCNSPVDQYIVNTVKPVLSGHSKRTAKLVLNTNCRFMQVKSIAECSKGHSAILSTFIKLPFVFKTFFFVYFKWPLKTGFTVYFFSLGILPDIVVVGVHEGLYIDQNDDYIFR